VGRFVSSRFVPLQVQAYVLFAGFFNKLDPVSILTPAYYYYYYYLFVNELRYLVKMSSASGT
jgi:hypothetical protein